MKPTLKILSIGILALCVCSGVVLAQDHPGEGPPNELRYRALSQGTVRTVSSTGAVSFRTDTGPELDFYQPCNGGNNEINFAINLHGVDLATAQNARLTMAVWDIDFDCGTSCSGNCERDTVFVNGTQLTTPVSYLTGADSQWSSVSFDVPISALVDGDNEVQIFIDTLGNGCWCATCDWAELTMDADAAPEIQEIEVQQSHLWGLFYTTLDYPVTEEEFYLKAKIKEVTGYEIVKVTWGGAVDPGDGNPYAVTMAKGDYGKKTVTATLTYKKTSTGEENTTAPTTKEIKVFFPKSKDDDGDGEPNWFDYWPADGAVPGMQDFKFNAAMGGYGMWVPATTTLWVGPPAAKVHYPSGIYVAATGVTFGGAEGIDCAAEVAAHERYHKLITENNAGPWVGLASTDSDGLIDDYETGTSGTLIDDPDTYGLAAIKSPVYSTYGDQEYMAMSAGDGQLGFSAKDWAYPGKQTPGAVAAAASTSRIRVLPGQTSGRRGMAATTAFTGVYTDLGTDTNANSLYDYLAVGVGVDVEKDYDYSIVGWIQDGAGLQVGIVNDLVHLAAGTHTVELDFDGVRIHELGSGGPYQLSVTLGEPDGVEFDSKLLVHTTAAYTISQFEGNQAYSGPPTTELAKDNDSDGKYDQLDLTVTVNVTIAGTYDVSGFLTAPSGATICHLKSAGPLVVGANSVVLTAPGNLIRQSRADGPYTLSALGISDGTKRIDYKASAYDTQAYAYVSFAGGEAEIGAATSFIDAGVDLDADTFFDVLRLTVPVTVTLDGTYALTAGLFDSDGGLICDAYTQSALTAGANSVALDFSGESIHVVGKDGPYSVKYVSLYDASGTVYDRLPVPYSTTAYTANQFDAPAVALTGQYDDSSIDSNSDGIYESLQVDVEVLVANAGTYAMNARLMDRNDAEIDWASTTAFVAAGTPQTLHLSFDGPKIYAHGVNGPYYLRDVYVYNSGNTSQFDRAYSPYTTKAAWRVVANQPPVANAGSDRQVSADTTSGKVVTLDGTGSTDPDSYPGPSDDIVGYQWLEGATVIGAGVQANALLAIGVHTITLRVTDSLGLTAEDTVVVTVPFVNPPTVAFTLPTSAATCLRNTASVNIAGTCTPGATLAWAIDTGGSGACTGGVSWTGGPLTLTAGANVITVTATDIIGRTGSATLTATFDATVTPGAVWAGTAMVSLPLIPDQTDPKPVVGFDGNGWYAYTVAAGYIPYTDHGSWFEPATATPGRGFWAYFPASGAAAPTGTAPSQTDPKTIQLKAGWNLIGQPFISAVAWNLDAIKVTEAAAAPKSLRDAGDLMKPFAWGWSSAAGSYYLVYDPATVAGSVGELAPWQAYWVKAIKDCDLTLPAPTAKSGSGRGSN